MRFQTLLFILSILFTFSACDDDDNPELTKGNIAIATTIPNPDGLSGSSYLQLTETFNTKTLDNSLAYQMPFSSPCYIFDDDIFVMPGLSSDILTKYSRNENKELVKTGSLLLPSGSWAFNMVKTSDEKAYVALWGSGEIWEINPTTMIPTDTIDVSSYGVGDVNPDPTGMCIRDGKLYVALYQIVGGYYPLVNRPFSDMLIINTTTNTVDKMISTESLPGLSSTGLSTPTRPIDNQTIFIDENNDIYVVCTGALGGYPGVHKTGLLRINSNETDFDESYKFVVSDSTVIGESNAPGYIANVIYMGNGKLYANINFPAYYDPVDPSDYFDRTVAPVLIDIYAQTVTKLPFTKRSNGFTNISKYNDKIIYGMITDSDQGFYTYDLLTGEASSKPVITTKGYPAFFGYFDN